MKALQLNSITHNTAIAILYWQIIKLSPDYKAFILLKQKKLQLLKNEPIVLLRSDPSRYNLLLIPSVIGIPAYSCIGLQILIGMIWLIKVDE